MAIQGPIQTAAVAIGVDNAGRKALVTERREYAGPPVAVSMPAAAERKPVVSAEDIRVVHAKIAERLQQYLQESGRDVEFRVDSGANATVLTVRRADTGEVIRQFPTEEALAWMRRLNEQSGTFLDELV